MLNKELIWIIAAIIGILWNIPYIIQIFKWNQKPQKVSWFIWGFSMKFSLFFLWL